MKKIKKMDIKEFRESGYLQEANRQFFHPLGIALEITLNQDGSENITGIWDYRSHDAGIYFDFKNRNAEMKNEMIKKANNIKNILKKRNPKRFKMLGFKVEPIPK